MKKQLTYMTRIFLYPLLLIQISSGIQGDDHNIVRELRHSGNILSLEAVLEKYKSEHYGKILNITLRTDSGMVIYDIQLLKSNGSVYTLSINAVTGEVLTNQKDN